MKLIEKNEYVFDSDIKALLKWKKCYHEGHLYDSLDEAACATLMQFYIEDFRIVKRETFQVSPTPPKSIDFLINRTFVEYHPFPMEFKWDESYEILQEEYFRERKKLIDESLSYNNFELIVVSSLREFYEGVIMKFGKGHPLEDEFNKMFKDIRDVVKTSNKHLRVLMQSDAKEALRLWDEGYHQDKEGDASLWDFGLDYNLLCSRVLERQREYVEENVVFGF